MDLYIYNSGLELIGLVDVFDSLRWRRRYFTAGEFELHLFPNSSNIKLFEIGNIIGRRDAEECGIVENIEINNEALIVTGRFLSSLFDRRIVWERTTLRTTAENAMRTLVNNMQPIPNLTLGVLKNYPEIVDVQVTYKNVASTLTKIAMVSGIGYIVKRASGSLVFECYKGLDRSINQSVNPRAIFSEDFENINNSRYSIFTESQKNVALVGGGGEGNERVLVTVGDATGYERRELFVDAKDLQQGDLTLEEYTDLLRQRGLEALAETVESEVFESSVNLHSNIAYRTDFDLGDIVTCRNRAWGKTIDARVTEVEEVYENGVTTITPTFGSPLPELKDILKEE